MNLKKIKRGRKRKKVIIYLLSFLFIVCASTSLFLNLNPVFGGNPTKEQKESYKQYDNYSNGKFINKVSTGMGMKLADFVSMTKDSFGGSKERKPTGEVPVSAIDWNKINSEEDSMTWLGHSAYLLSIDNKKLLLDPMLGPIASPVSFVGTKRYKYSEDMKNIIDEMPPIDVVFISHDHYDHLDYKSIVKLKSKVSHFFVPLGVGNHLIRWGVPKEKITELNWFKNAEYQGLTVALTPSRHFSGRGMFNSGSTLWGGWAILGKNTRLYYSGDGGYGSHFKEIGEKYGPFDMALIEGGQYDQRWAGVHMTPEQSVQANIDLKGKNMMLMHWSAFTLAFHGWKEPVERAIKEAEKREVSLIAPEIGETVPVDSDGHSAVFPWWDY
jgi:L-ascorbate metabolism protein UlaG (beta-lactamase superfamily)